MTLEEKIRDRKIVYLFRRRAAIAFELALLYFTLAKRKNAKEKIVATCQKALYWLKKAGIALPDYIIQLSGSGQLDEIEKILLTNRAIVDARTA